jgi:hypothetical protein
MAGISTFCHAAAFASSSKSRYQPVAVDRFAQHVALAAIDCAMVANLLGKPVSRIS